MSRYLLTSLEKRFRLDEWLRRNLQVEARSGPEWLCVCPKCGRDKLAVNVGKKAFQCLSAACQWRSRSPTELVAGTLGVSRGAADHVIRSFVAGIELGPMPPLDAEEERTRPAREIPAAPLPPVAWELLPPQAEYVRSRDVPDEHARLFGLATTLPDGSGSRVDTLLADRVLFPVWGPTSRIVFWAARSIACDARIKILNTPRACRESEHSRFCTCYHAEWGLPQVPRSASANEIVLGLHLAKPGEPIIVVEGPMDAAVCGPGFVATLKAAISPSQATQIAATGASEAIILYDGDAGGRAGAIRAAHTLGQAIPTRIANCPDGCDPGDLGRVEALRVAHSSPRPGGVGELENRRYTAVDGARSPHPWVAGLD